MHSLAQLKRTFMRLRLATIAMLSKMVNLSAMVTLNTSSQPQTSFETQMC